MARQEAARKLDMARIVTWAFADGLRFLTLGGGTDREVRICSRARGEAIEDPDCADDYEVLETGVYQRCRVTSSNKPDGWTWLHACDADGLADWLRLRLGPMTEREHDAACLEAVFQSGSHKDAEEAAAKRRRSREEAEATAAQRAERNAG